MKRWYVVFVIITAIVFVAIFSMGMSNVEQENEKMQHVSSFFTCFATSTTNRKFNIMLATSKFCWLVVQPGEVLSFNTIVGTRNVENGYKTAVVIKDGEYTEGVGGGVCQVSTTLYNAWIRAGLGVKTVRNHSLPASYVELSMDATVSDDIDLILVNNSQGRVVVNGSTTNEKVKFDVYATKLEYEIKVKSEIINTIKPPSPIIETVISFEDNRVYNDRGFEYIVLKKEKPGFHSAAYLYYYKDEQLIKKEKIREDYYTPVVGKLGVLD